MEDIKENAGFLALFAVLMLVILFILFYSTISKNPVISLINRSIKTPESRETIRYILVKVAGLMYLGIIPFVIFIMIIKIPLPAIGLDAGQSFKYWYLILALLMVTVFISFLFSRGKSRETKPELMLSDWYPLHIIISSIGWAIYLFGYELLFRGILWFICFDAFGLWPALAINIFLYSAVHIPKGKFMTLGALPLGVIFCLLSHMTGSFLPAFFIHLTMAISTDFFSVYYNPEIRFHLTGK